MGEIDKAIDGLAERQRFVFTRSQAQSLGATDAMIRTRVEGARWVRLASGVYALPGSARDPLTRLKAATLAIPGAVASHESAAALHGFPNVARDRIVVSAPPGANHRNRLARVHEYMGIDIADHTTRRDIPVTTPALTIFHLASVLHPVRIERILDDCLSSNAVQIEDLRALVEFWTRKGRRRVHIMRGLVAARGEGYVAPESELESAFLDLVRRYGLPEPVRQFATPWDPEEGRVDFAYLRRLILIEVDGRRWHSRDQASERDRARDRKAQLLGWRVLRYGYAEITRRAASTAAEISEFIDRSDAT